jgi:hypothetical protein
MRPPSQALIGAGLLALALGGCQQNLPEQKAKTEKAICTELAVVGQALEQVAALKPTSTVGEAQAADRALASALTALEASKEQLENLRLKTFKTQLRTFRGEVQRVASNKKLTIEQAAQVLKAKSGPLIAARKALNAEVDCVEIPKP